MTGSVYFISDQSGRFKIGYSSDPAARLNALQTANGCNLEIIGLIEAPQNLEAALHKRFSKWHLKGEWFEQTRSAMEELGRVLADPPASTETSIARRLTDQEDIELANRIAMFLIDSYPLKTADCVASDLGVHRTAAQHWVSCRSLPNGPAILRMISVYGPAFLAGVMRPVPDWVSKFAASEQRATDIDKLALLRAKLAQLEERAQ